MLPSYQVSDYPWPGDFTEDDVELLRELEGFFQADDTLTFSDIWRASSSWAVIGFGLTDEARAKLGYELDYALGNAKQKMIDIAKALT